jgi:integrase
VLFRSLAARPLVAIDAAMVRALDADFVRAGVSRPARRQIQLVLRSVIRRFAVEAKLIAEPPPMPPLPKMSTKIPAVLSADDARRIVATAKHAEHRIALLLAFHAGLRACEIRGLRVCDVDQSANVLRVRQAVSFGVVDTPKSGNDREVPLTRALCEALTTAIKGRSRNARVALSTRGQPWGQDGLRGMFVRLAKRASVEGGTFHHLRHGFITTLLDRGVGAHVVRELAGHADLATTERYAHAASKNKHAAIATLEEPS